MKPTENTATHPAANARRTTISVSGRSPTTPAAFKRTYYPAIERLCAETGLSPLFVAAQAALESGWGAHAIGNNLFGITADRRWKGPRRIVTTTEYRNDDRGSAEFVRVHSVTQLPDGRYRYVVDRAFRDYATVEECLRDHFRVLSSERYRQAMQYRDQVRRFAYEIARAGYCTADPTHYADSIDAIARMIERL